MDDYSAPDRKVVGDNTIFISGAQYDTGHNGSAGGEDIFSDHLDSDGLLQDFGSSRLLGLGGMGAVFEINDPALQRKVALKVLREEFRYDKNNIARFIREARNTARVDHPNIIPVHRLGKLEEVGVYFTMKRIKGETLRSIIRKLAAGNHEVRHHYTLRRLLSIFIAACNGVMAAHDCNLLHCDLKPGNLMVGNLGEVLVLDWGVAREAIPAGPPAKDNEEMIAQPHKVEGTPGFMAPELLAGELFHPDEQTDVYSLGAILYSILSWEEAPYDLDLSKEELVNLAAQGKFIPLRQRKRIDQPLPPELVAICHRAMNRNRLERYPNVRSLLEDLGNYLDGYPVTAYSPGLLYRFFKFVLRHPLIPSVILAAGITIGAYYSINYLVDYIQDNALLRLIEESAGEGNQKREQALSRIRHLQQEQASMSPAEITRNKQLISFYITNATLEFCSVLDSASRLPSARQQEFMSKDGAYIFRHLLRMQLYNSDYDMAMALVKRFSSQWSALFRAARERDSQLNQLIEETRQKYRQKAEPAQ